MKNILSLSLLFCLFGFHAIAQDQPKEIDEMKLKLNEDGSHYLKATFLNQVWLRYNDSNPGTLVLNDPTKQTLDIGLRRTRFQMYGQLTDHVFFYFQFGQNNFNYLSQKLLASLLRFLGDYFVEVGAGVDAHFGILNS